MYNKIYITAKNIIVNKLICKLYCYTTNERKTNTYQSSSGTFRGREIQILVGKEGWCQQYVNAYDAPWTKVNGRKI
tara:strand:- start:533 stop:760 length:228 start_codon:yes stop_codon:yes gene_type:complete